MSFLLQNHVNFFFFEKNIFFQDKIESNVAGNGDKKVIVVDFITNIIYNSFPNILLEETESYIKKLFENCQNIKNFKSILRDFLIEMNCHGQERTEA